VTKQAGRKWILLAEKWSGTVNTIRANTIETGLRLRLPDMLPDAWTTAVLAASSKIVANEGVWELTFSEAIHPLLEILLRNANIQLI
jgi:hypothetical protein